MSVDTRFARWAFPEPTILVFLNSIQKVLADLEKDSQSIFAVILSHEKTYNFSLVFVLLVRLSMFLLNHLL